MSRYLYHITRYLAVLLVTYNIITRGINFDAARNIQLVVSLLLFLLVSVLYERKNLIFTPTYIVYFVVVFIIHNVSPYTYIDNRMMLDTIIRNPFAKIPKDHYNLYFSIYLTINILIIFYLLLKKKVLSERLKLSLKPNSKEAVDILLISLLLLPVQIILGSTFRKLLIPSAVYFLASVYMFKNIRIKQVYFIGVILSVIVIISQITWRFIAVQYILPVLITIILHKAFTTLPRKINNREKALLVIGVLGVIFYGIVSEMYKLGSLVKIEDLRYIFTNGVLLFSWLERQGYRIFDIWTVLGGNIIDYASEFGFFYGLTYIKVLASVLGFEYISLPTISAQLVGANYAQPGLIAEGYANFGYYGALLNIIAVLILLEFLWRGFLKSQNMRNLLLVVVPFTSVLLDGGSFNSMIFNIILIHITFTPRYVKFILWRGKNEN